MDVWTVEITLLSTPYRKVTEMDGTHTLRQPKGAYAPDSSCESDTLTPDNTILWQKNEETFESWRGPPRNKELCREGFMLIPRLAVWLFSAGMMVLASGIVAGQNYPNKPVRIVTIEPGGGGDLAARLIAQGLTASLGRQVVVDNRGGGVIAIEIVAKAPPNGYTLLIYGGTLWIGPLLLNDVSWNPVRDFSPITSAVRVPNLVVVHPSLPVRSVTELIALAQARPGELNYGSGSTGASAHLAAELFKGMTGVSIVRISYKGTGSAINALIGGQVQLMFPTVASAAPHVKSGRLRALAVTTAQPSALAPGLPTVAASGLRDYESSSIFGVFVPAKTPAALINLLNQEIVRVLNKTEVKERLFTAGVEVVGNTPEEFAATMKSDVAKWGKLIKEAGIHE